MLRELDRVESPVRPEGRPPKLAMREGIHPDYVECTGHGSCGNEFVTRATVGKVNVEICSACHPFFAGKQKFVDAAGRIDRFKERYSKGKA